METWIFKIIWVPIACILGMCASAILTVMMKDIGWDVPFRWLVIIGAIALFADQYLNRG